MLYSIHQPNFIPWIGFFHKILSSDKVILFDSVQISSGKSYTSRVKILFKGEEKWLTIPVKKAGSFGQKICQTELIDFQINWRKALGTIKQAYSKAEYFKEVFPLFEKYTDSNFNLLCDLNISIIREITDLLGGNTIEFLRSSAIPELMTSTDKQTDYIVQTCRCFNITNYLSGKGGSSEFLEKNKFTENNIKITFQEFNHPKYQQISASDFQPGMSIIDMLMNLGLGKTREILTKDKV